MPKDVMVWGNRVVDVKLKIFKLNNFCKLREIRRIYFIFKQTEFKFIRFGMLKLDEYILRICVYYENVRWWKGFGIINNIV